MNHSYEIEIKSLLGGKEKADELISKMKASDPSLQVKGSHKQLNHYFVPSTGNLKTLFENVKNILSTEEKNKLEDLANKAKDFSVRTRWATSVATDSGWTDGAVILVVKATIDDTTSSNGTARLEFESKLNNLTLEELDKLILDSGFAYQAKWSRERSDYTYNNMSVSIDKNAGYGYLAEFEMVVDDKEKAEETKFLIRKIMQDLGVAELPQDRLARMFDFYNKNWEQYYGTENIFNIE